MSEIISTKTLGKNSFTPLSATKKIANLWPLFFLLCTLSFNSYAAVIASIKPIAFITAAITDGITDTEVLLPDGASPHNYALKPSDIQRLRSAELVVWIGEDMEVFLAKTLQRVDQQKQIALSHMPTINHLIVKGHDDDHEHDHENQASYKTDSQQTGGHGEYDLHIWLSPAIAKQIGITIFDKLLQLMPENAVKLEQNLQDFLQDVEKTEQFIEKNLKSVQNKGYFVFHDAYAYFEQRFGLHHLGSFTINPELQPGAQKLYQIKTQLIEDNAVCVFSEPQFRPTVIDVITQGTQVRSGSVDPLGINIALGKHSYREFLVNLSTQFYDCLNDNKR